MEKFDVVVVGLGAMGSAALYHAAKKGLKVLGIEQFHQVPHTNGSHHGSTRIIRQAYFEDPSYVPLVQRAYELWRRLEQDSGNRLFVKTGGLVIGEPNSEVVTGAIQSATTHNLPYEVLSRAQVENRYPAFRLDDSQVAVLEPDAGYLLCEVAVRDHVEQAVARGAQIQLDTKVVGWKSTSSGVVVDMAGVLIHANRLILTVGAGAPELVPSLPLAVERQVVFWFQPSAGRLEDIPIYIVEEPQGFSYYGFPEIPSQGAKVAFHHGGQVCSPNTIDRDVSAQEIERMRSVVSKRIPSLVSATLLQSSVCMYTNTPDLHFVVGEHPHDSNVILGLGFSGHGFKFSSAMGEQLVKLACGESANYIPALFSPTRWLNG